MSLGLAATITDAGISAPSFAEILTTLQAKIREIYGSDIYIDPDSKDGQLIALVAQAINDANDTAIAAHAQFSPSSAVGKGLSSIVKTNGISRQVASYSSAIGTAVGQVGTVITNGVVKDENGNLWNLPASVTIPPAGQISVTVTAQQLGAITAPAGTIDKLATPAYGWQSFVSTTDATPGAPIELDAPLRKRQSVSTALPSVSPLGSLQGTLLNVTGVTAVKLYENTTATTDANGIPKNSICVVIQGGDLATIAQTIGQKKTPGADTYGTTTQSYRDPVTGILYAIKFFVLTTIPVKIRITGTALTGYTTATTASIQQAVADYLNSYGIGETVEFTGLWAPAYLNKSPRLQPYRVDTIQVSTDGGTNWNTNDVAGVFNKIITCASVADVGVTIV